MLPDSKTATAARILSLDKSRAAWRTMASADGRWAPHWCAGITRGLRMLLCVSATLLKAQQPSATVPVLQSGNGRALSGDMPSA